MSDQERPDGTVQVPQQPEVFYLLVGEGDNATALPLRRQDSLSSSNQYKPRRSSSGRDVSSEISASKRFSCKSCSKTFERKFGLKRHMNTRHCAKPEDLFQCIRCGKYLKSKASLQAHMIGRVCLSPKEFQRTNISSDKICPECHTVLNSEASENNHKKKCPKQHFCRENHEHAPIFEYFETLENAKNYLEENSLDSSMAVRSSHNTIVQYHCLRSETNIKKECDDNDNVSECPAKLCVSKHFVKLPGLSKPCLRYIMSGCLQHNHENEVQHQRISKDVRKEVQVLLKTGLPTFDIIEACSYDDHVADKGNRIPKLKRTDVKKTRGHLTEDPVPIISTLMFDDYGEKSFKQREPSSDNAVSKKMIKSSHDAQTTKRRLLSKLSYLTSLVQTADEEKCKEWIQSGIQSVDKLIETRTECFAPLIIKK